ncbi:MAG: Zn-ribbon domain-containing OB-fold protein [Proteobacteria bacterium]|nr:Zn-ribbon domain-containing OB-fold protein [Pseudomonadota bacterium]
MADIGTAQSAQAPACDQRYFGALAEGRFEIPRCKACGRHHFYPRVCCPHCGAQDLEWVQLTGRGTVYSVTIVRRADGDYTVVLVDLEEGPRLMSRVVDMPVEQVRIGLAVCARIDQTEDGPLLVFTAREEHA